MDAAQDSAVPEDSATPVDASADSGPMCGRTQHLCGEVCTDPRPNLPENGCRLGCDVPCPQPGATCDGEGRCTTGGCVPSVTCESAGAMCGTVDDGCGNDLACGTCSGGLTCNSGTCGCMLDVFEANDMSGSAAPIGMLTDEPDSSATVMVGNIHATDDVDWYSATVENNCCLGDPVIEVILDVPSGEDYDVTVYYQCPDSSTPTCDEGTPTSAFASGGCIGNAVGNDTVELSTNCDPDGVVYIMVRAHMWNGSCAPYELTVNVR